MTDVVHISFSTDIPVLFSAVDRQSVPLIIFQIAWV